MNWPKINFRRLENEFDVLDFAVNPRNLIRCNCWQLSKFTPRKHTLHMSDVMKNNIFHRKRGKKKDSHFNCAVANKLQNTSLTLLIQYFFDKFFVASHGHCIHTSIPHPNGQKLITKQNTKKKHVNYFTRVKSSGRLKSYNFTISMFIDKTRATEAF